MSYQAKQREFHAAPRVPQKLHRVKNTMAVILNAPDKDVKKTFGPNGVLSRLFRVMLYDLDIGGMKFSQFLQDYITDARHGIPNNPKDQMSMRGNLTKEFSRPQMTWKVFCKALRFLQFQKVTFTITALHADGVTETYHKTVVDFGQRREIHQFNQQLDQPETQEATLPVAFLDTVMDDEQEDA